jgi:hypothetical protein
VTPFSSTLSFNIPLPENKIEMGYTLKTKVNKKVPFLNPGPDGEVTFRLICRQLFYREHRVGWVIVGL